jgi:hypothetical protein
MKLTQDIKRHVKRIAFEAWLHWVRLKSPSNRPCVLIFPSNQPWDAASNLRAWLIASELREKGWRVLIIPEPLSLQQRRRIVRLERPDVLLLQQTRHILNQPKLYRPYPCVLDADDGDFLDPNYTERIAESAKDAATVIGGSRFVASCLARENAAAHVLWTCTPRPQRPPETGPENRPPVIVWAHSSPLKYPHEAAFVREVMGLVCQRMSCEFWLFGTTENEAEDWFSPIRKAGGKCIAIPPLSYEEYLHKVSMAAIGLQPIAPENAFSQGKSFGKLLAYLSGQVAVVASHAVDHPLFFKSGVNGMLPEHSPAAWCDAICQLLRDKPLRCNIANQGWKDFHSRLTTEVFSDLLDPVLREAAGLPLSTDHQIKLEKTLLKRPTKGVSTDHNAPRG